MSDQQPWYHEGLRFRCTGCGGCCTGAPGYVWVTKAEIAALAAALDFQLEKFTKRYIRSVGVRYSLIELADGDCIFFDRVAHRCRVYRARPRQCRTWPFWESNLRTPQTWEDTARQCPGMNRGSVVPYPKIMTLSAAVKGL